MGDVFKALADPLRRKLLDQLHETDGLTLGMLCEHAGMTRQAVSKHLRILEEADLVMTRMSGRQKFHYLNPVPIEEITARWLTKFSQHQAHELIQLRNQLEDKDNGQ